MGYPHADALQWLSPFKRVAWSRIRMVLLYALSARNWGRFRGLWLPQGVVGYESVDSTVVVIWHVRGHVVSPRPHFHVGVIVYVLFRDACVREPHVFDSFNGFDGWRGQLHGVETGSGET